MVQTDKVLEFDKMKGRLEAYAVYLLHKKGVYDTAGIKCNLFPKKCLLFQMSCCPLGI